MGHYKSNVRDLEFNLFELLDLEKVLANGEFGDLDGASVRELLAEAARQAEGPLAESFADADRHPPTFDPDAHTVTLPEAFKESLRTWQAGEWYRIQVIDTGRGMTEEQRTNLFHPFQSFFDGGTGIGMAIVYRIVQDHGGRLRVDSRPGAGTTITVELPTAGASVTLVSAEAPA